MPAIVAYSNNADSQVAFREGMKALGQLLLANTGPSENTDKKKTRGVKKALKAVLNDPGLELRFQNAANTGGNSRGFFIADLFLAGGKIVCTLSDQQNVDQGTLTLEVKMDNPRDVSTPPDSNEYSMRINFPEPTDDNGATYLDGTAAHLRVLFESSPSNEDAKNFLAAFKFLSRCK